MTKLYGSHGYINFVATPITDVDNAARRISLIMELDEGKQFRVGKVEVFGLEPSKAAMLTSILKPGDIFKSGLVDDFVKANMTGLSEEESREVFEMRKSEKEGMVDIVFDFRRWNSQGTSKQ
jgi:outer membrane protein insertion porin family